MKHFYQIIVKTCGCVTVTMDISDLDWSTTMAMENRFANSVGDDAIVNVVEMTESEFDIMVGIIGVYSEYNNMDEFNEKINGENHVKKINLSGGMVVNHFKIIVETKNAIEIYMDETVRDDAVVFGKYNGLYNRGTIVTKSIDIIPMSQYKWDEYVSQNGMYQKFTK